MGFRFRKSTSFGPFRINLSKSGIGYSVGTKGFRVTKKATGGTRTTASIPGTGISYVKEDSQKSKAGENTMAKKSKKPLSGKSIAGGLAALCIIGAITGGGEETPSSPSHSSQGLDNISTSASSSIVDISQELPGGAEISDISTSDVSQEGLDASVSQQEIPAAPATPVIPAVVPENTQSQSDPDPEPIAQTYIGNRNTKKFHWPSCSSVGDMKEKNKVTLKSRDEAISKGYKPCGRCHP